jgi:hypothetical protein
MRKKAFTAKTQRTSRKANDSKKHIWPLKKRITADKNKNNYLISVNLPQLVGRYMS